MRKSLKRTKNNDNNYYSSPSKKVNKFPDIKHKEKLMTILRQELDEKLLILFSSQASLMGFKQDIDSILNDLHLSHEKLFEIVLEFLSKSIRKENEIRIIVAYLFSMQGLTNLLLKTINIEMNNKDKNLLNNLLVLGRTLAYEKFPKDYVLIRFGEKGSKAYINLSGDVAVLIKKQYKIKMSEEEYLYYLANLIRFQEYELVNIVVNENYKIFPIEIIDDLNEVEFEKKNLSSVSGKYFNKFNNINVENSFNNVEKKISKDTSFLNLNNKSTGKLIQNNLNKNNSKKKSLRPKLRLNQENEKLKNLSTPTMLFTSTLLKKYNLNYIHKKLLNRCNVEEYIQRLNTIEDYDFKENKYINEKDKDKEKEEKTKQNKKENDKENNKENENDKTEKKTYFTIYLYLHVVNLSKGSLFGEMALNNKNSLRNATIITLDDCHCGVLNKKTYNNCLKNGAEKNLYDILYFIVELPIFRGIQPGVFLRKYYTSLSRNSINKSYKIIIQGEKPEYIALLKSGQYTIYTYNSLYNITNLMIYYLKINRKRMKNDEIVNKIMLSIKITNKLLLENEKFRIYYFSKNNYKVGEMSCPDIIGYNEYIDKDGKYAFSIESKALKGDFFLLKNTFYEEIMRKNEIVRNNQYELYSSKIELILERLYNMRKIVINTFFEYKTKEKIGNIVCKEIDDIIINKIKYKRFKKLFSTNYKIPSKQKDENININIINTINNCFEYNKINEQSKNHSPLLNLKTISKIENNNNCYSNIKNKKDYSYKQNKYNISFKLNNINNNNKINLSNKNYNKTINYFNNHKRIFKYNKSINNKKTKIENYYSDKKPINNKRDNFDGICLNNLIWEDIKEQIKYPIFNDNEIINNEKYSFRKIKKNRKRNILPIRYYKDDEENENKNKLENEKSLNLLSEEYMNLRTLPICKIIKKKKDKIIETNNNRMCYTDRINNKIQDGENDEIDRLNYDIERNNYYKNNISKRLNFIFRKKK